MYYACVCTCIFVHSLHAQNKEFCSVLFCSALEMCNFSWTPHSNLDRDNSVKPLLC